MEKTPPVSACVITLNEEDNIRRCLESVQWTDEIVVVDSGSDDRTTEIAEEMGARVLFNEWPGHVKQKQYATDQANNDWILSIDADEYLGDELIKAIQRLFKGDTPPSNHSFKLNRISNYLGTWLRHGSWHPDYIIRLFNRRKTQWGGYDPHDKVLPTSTTRKLDGLLYHYPYEDLSDHLDYINNYTDTMAYEKNEQGVEGTVTKALTHSAFKLFKEMALKWGFLDGKAGIVAAGMSTWYVFLKYAKLWELQNRNPDHSDQDSP